MNTTDLAYRLVQQDIITTDELCAILQCSPAHVSELVAEGMPVVWQGRPRRFSWQLCAQWFRDRAASSQADRNE